jgi:hypothetical protein
MENFLDYELQEFVDEEKKLKLSEIEANKAALKETLAPLVKQLREANLEKEDAETAFSAAKERVANIEAEIRKVWGPFIEGVDKASIDVDGSRLESAVVINIKTLNDDYLAWLKANGYEDVMKWQVHHQTLKSIANKLYADSIQIPGLEYSKFNKIKLK